MKKYIPAIFVAVLNLIDIVVLLLCANTLFESLATLFFCIAALLICPIVLLSKLAKVSQQNSIEYKILQVYAAILLACAVFVLAVAILFVCNYSHRDLVCTVLAIISAAGVFVYAMQVFSFHIVPNKNHTSFK